MLTKISEAYKAQRKISNKSHQDLVREAGVPNVADFSNGFFKQLYARYKDMQKLHPHGSLHSNFSENASVLTDAHYVVVQFPDKSVHISTTTLSVIGLVQFAKGMVYLDEDEYETEMQSILKDNSDDKALRFFLNYQEMVLQNDYSVPEKDKAESGSLLVISHNDVVDLLGVRAGQPVCANMNLDQHAANWTSSVDDSGMVIIEPRDPNYTSLQMEETFLEAYFTGYYNEGWCQTWQEFDYECIVAGVKKEHDALKDAAVAFCAGCKDGKPSPNVPPLLKSIARDFGNVEPQYVLTTLVKYLFLRNVEFFIVCTQRHPAFLQENLQRQKPRFISRHQEKIKDMTPEKRQEEITKFETLQAKREKSVKDQCRRYSELYQRLIDCIWQPMLQTTSTDAQFTDRTLAHC